MKRSLSLLVFLLVPLLCCAQGKLYTKSRRLADFPAHTTKVVLSGRESLDNELRNAVYARWRLSPFEFCTMDEYETLRDNPSFYFLRFELNRDKRSSETGLEYISLSKGGDRKDRQSLDAAFDVISVPVAPLHHADGREYGYLPALVNILQNYVEDAIVSDGKSLAGLKSRNPGPFARNAKPVYIASSDIAASGAAQVLPRYPSAFRVLPSSQVDSVFRAEPDSVLVGIVVSPKMPQFGGVSFQMVIDPSTHDLFYYSSHAYSVDGQRGFNSSEIIHLGKLNR